MPLYLSGTNGVYGVNGSNATPATAGSDTDTGVFYGTNTVSLATNGTTAVTVDSSQNVGIGISSPSAKFEINTTAAYQPLTVSGKSNPLIFLTDSSATTNDSTDVTLQTYNGVSTSGPYWSRINFNASGYRFKVYNTEYVRIDSSGNLLVGTTSTSFTSSPGIKMLPAANGTNLPGMAIVGAGNSDAYGTYHVYSTTDSAYKFYTTLAGKIYATTTTVQAITSDVRLKTDIRDYDLGLAQILAMKPRYFKYKNNLATEHAGFIAQEMDEAIPGSMVDAIGGEYKTYSADWYPILVKAIQELSAKNDALEARIAALEAN